MSVNQNKVVAFASLLSQAFYHDPLFEYFFPGNSTRQSLSFYTFKFILAHAFENGFILNSSSHGQGVSIWLPSDNMDRSLADQLRFGALSMCFKQGLGAIKRQSEANEHMKTIHKSCLKIPHLYLSTIGIDKAFRGKGVAGGLIQPMLDKADNDHLPCYLDTHNEANIAKYQRYGFEVVHQSLITGSPVMHWAMIRPAG